MNSNSVNQPNSSVHISTSGTNSPYMNEIVVYFHEYIASSIHTLIFSCFGTSVVPIGGFHSLSNFPGHMRLATPKSGECKSGLASGLAPLLRWHTCSPLTK